MKKKTSKLEIKTLHLDRERLVEQSDVSSEEQDVSSRPVFQNGGSKN